MKPQLGVKADITDTPIGQRHPIFLTRAARWWRKWQKRLTDADRRALSPLFWTHVNPYGRFELDMNSHLALAAAASMVPGPRTASDSQTP